MTVREIGARLQRREISCVELVRSTIQAIESGDRSNSLITRTFEQALQQAAKLDAEPRRGPFHGIPIAHKDLFYTRGVRTTGGSLIYKDFVPEFDADVVAKLNVAGAISIGKANLHELAYGIRCNNAHYGAVLNPLDPERIPGGSSGGSAALVAAGFLAMATGTDSGGSIRIPASYCGIAGFKPTYDVLSRRGILPLNYSLDHAGPMGTCVDDCALAMNAMSGTTAFDLPPLADLKTVRVGVPDAFFFERVHPEVERAVKASLTASGARIETVRLPDFNELNAAARVIQMAEATALYINYSDASLFGADVWTNIQDGRQIFGHEYVNAQRLRRVHRKVLRQIWKTVDVIATPTTAITAPLRNEVTIDINGRDEDVRLASTRLVRGWNYLGEPAISIPCGKDSKGLPIGLQLIAAPYRDARLLQIAKLFERQA